VRIALFASNKEDIDKVVATVINEPQNTTMKQNESAVLLLDSSERATGAGRINILNKSCDARFCR
jgi:hypothetical protein